MAHIYSKPTDISDINSTVKHYIIAKVDMFWANDLKIHYPVIWEEFHESPCAVDSDVRMWLYINCPELFNWLENSQIDWTGVESDCIGDYNFDFKEIAIRMHRPSDVMLFSMTWCL